MMKMLYLLIIINIQAKNCKIQTFQIKNLMSIRGDFNEQYIKQIYRRNT